MNVATTFSKININIKCSLVLFDVQFTILEFIFIPVAVETFGSWGQIGLKFIKDLGTRIADRTGEKRSTAFLFQSISMAVQRGNAASVLGTLPSSRKLEEIFTFWSGLCTKLKIKTPIPVNIYNSIELEFHEFMLESDIPGVKTYISSEENSSKYYRA